MKKRVESATSRSVRRVKDYKSTFGTVVGNRVLHDLMNTHYILRPTLDVDNAHVTSFREGQRDVVLRIFTILKMNPVSLEQHINKIQEELEANE